MSAFDIRRPMLPRLDTSVVTGVAADVDQYAMRESPFDDRSAWRDILLNLQDGRTYQLMFHLESTRNGGRAPRRFAAVWIYVDIALARTGEYQFSLSSVVACVANTGTYPHTGCIAQRIFPSFAGVAEYIASIDAAVPRFGMDNLECLTVSRPQRSLLETEIMHWLCDAVDSVAPCTYTLK
jgi:hypothetical protein